MENTKQYRVLEIFFRGLCGEDISVEKLANEYGVSTKSVSRSISDLKAFLADNRELVGNTELEYSHKDKCYRLFMDEFVSDRFEGTELGWAYSFVTGYSGLIDLLNHVEHIPNYYAQIFDYFIDVLNYDMNIEFENGEVCELNRIRDALGL